MLFFQRLAESQIEMIDNGPKELSKQSWIKR